VGVQRPGPDRSRSGWCSRVEHQLRRPVMVGIASVLRLRVVGTSHRRLQLVVMGTLLGPEGTATDVEVAS